MKNERRKYEVILVFAVAILFLFCLIISAQAADMGEIHSGETRIWNITTAGQTDSFTFYANAGQGVVISMSQESGGLDPYILLYAPNGTKEVEVGDPTSYHHYEHALLKDHLLGQTGLYTIVVRDNSGNDVGNYSMSLVLIPGATTSPQDPDGGPIASGETKTGAISERADTDALSFYGEAGQGVVISMSQESGGLDPYILLYAPNGTKEVEVGDPTSYHHYEHALLKDHLLGQTGLYTIVVRDNSGNDVGNYSLSFTKIPPTPASGIYNPFPANGATITNLNQSCTWDAVSGATGYDLYFGEDVIVPLEKTGENLTSQEMPFPEMEWDKIYYWHVEAHISNGTIQGPYWWFKTEAVYQPPIANFTFK